MQVISNYLYQNKITAQIAGDYFDKRDKVVYAKNLIIHHGTDNTVYIEFKNPDQKKETILGKTISLVVFRDDGTTYLNLPVSIHDGAKGIGKVVFKEGDLLNMEPATYKYAVKMLDTEGDDQTVYVDDNYGVRGNIELQVGPKPTFISSVELTFEEVPSGPGGHGGPG